jgi:hypothetical protein
LSKPPATIEWEWFCVWYPLAADSIKNS